MMIVMMKLIIQQFFHLQKKVVKTAAENHHDDNLKNKNEPKIDENIMIWKVMKILKKIIKAQNHL